MKHSAHAFRIPHMLSEQSSKNVGIYQNRHMTSVATQTGVSCGQSAPAPIAYSGRATGTHKTAIKNDLQDTVSKGIA